MFPVGHHTHLTECYLGFPERTRRGKCVWLTYSRLCKTDLSEELKDLDDQFVTTQAQKAEGSACLGADEDGRDLDGILPLVGNAPIVEQPSSARRFMATSTAGAAPSILLL